METVDDLCTGIIHRILVLSVLERNQIHTQNNGNNGMNGNNGSTENNRNNKYSSDNQSDNKNLASGLRSQTGTSSSSSSSGKSYPSNKHTQDMKAPLSSVTSFVAQWLVELRYPIMRSTEIECCVVLCCVVLSSKSIFITASLVSFLPSYLLPLRALTSSPPRISLPSL